MNSSLSSAEIPAVKVLEAAAQVELERWRRARRDVVPIAPEPIDAIRVVVEPSEEPTVVYFRRFRDPASARLAAGGDPDAIVRESADHFGLLVRSEAGVTRAAGHAGAG